MFFNRYYQQQQQQQQQASPNTPMDQVTFQTYPMPETSTTAPANNNLPVKVFITISRRAKSHKCGVGRTPKRAPEEIRRFRTTEDVNFDQLKKQVAHVAKLQERKLEITSIKYKDEDGDFVNCDSQDEWTEAILNCSNSSAKVLVLSVVASRQCPSEDEEEEEEEKTKQQEEGKEVEEDEEKEKLSPRNHHPHHPHHHHHHRHPHPHHHGPRHHHPHHPHPRPPHHHPFQRSFHRNIVCDGCGQQGIVGMRHKCAFCPDYDLCESCFAKREQIHYRDHQFIPIEHPIPTFFCDASFVMVPPCQSSSSNEEKVTKTEEKNVVEQPKEEVKQTSEEVEVVVEEEKKEQENLDKIIDQVIENVVIPMEEEEKKEEEEEFVVVEPEPVPEPEPVKEEEEQEEEQQEEQEYNDGPVEVEQVEPVVVNVQPSAPSAPIEQQQAPSSTIDPAHATTLDILKQMGFDNEELALFLIRKHKNNVQLVVNEYLNHQ